jgi:hypothetical protein
MALNPGQSLHPDATDEETREAAEVVEEGDAVTLNSSGLVIKATDTDTVYGVAGDDHQKTGYESGDYLTVIHSGPVVANVAAGVAPATELAGTATAGQLGAGDSSKGIVSKFAEGGGPEAIPDGYAHVDI